MPSRSGVILRCRDTVLLVQTQAMYNPRSKTSTMRTWGFPKGQQKPSDMKGFDTQDAEAIMEGLMRCAERELYEETSLELKLTRNHHRIRLGTTKFFIHWVDAQLPLCYDAIEDKKEIADIRWVPISDLRAGLYPMNHSLREFMTKSMSRQSSHDPISYAFPKETNISTVGLICGEANGILT